MLAQVGGTHLTGMLSCSLLKTFQELVEDTARQNLRFARNVAGIVVLLLLVTVALHSILILETKGY